MATVNCSNIHCSVGTAVSIIAESISQSRDVTVLSTFTLTQAGCVHRRTQLKSLEAQKSAKSKQLLVKLATVLCCSNVALGCASHYAIIIINIIIITANLVTAVFWCVTQC
jgi:hypothetical protein